MRSFAHWKVTRENYDSDNRAGRVTLGACVAGPLHSKLNAQGKPACGCPLDWFPTVTPPFFSPSRLPQLIAYPMVVHMYGPPWYPRLAYLNYQLPLPNQNKGQTSNSSALRYTGAQNCGVQPAILVAGQ
jgi:hypothetical protein